jgi:hypothetical protein
MFSLLLLAAGLDHTAWTATLQRFVSPQARVDYAALNKEGLPELDAYLATLAQPFPSGISRDETKAALINAYNALTVRWVARHYPTASIWRTKKPFTEVRHTVNGRQYSLDQIETELRNMGDPRVHAVLVCAARSCPPLRREAYLPSTLDQQLSANTREWLANPVLNSFSPGETKVSKIFDWYRADFEKGGAKLNDFLRKYGPPAASAASPKLTFKDYSWGLNDSGTAGDSYGATAFYFDQLRNKIR